MRATLVLFSVTAMVLTLSVSAVLGWTKPMLTALCADDANHYAWQIDLPTEADYKIQFSWSADFSGAWTVDFATVGSHDFSTDRGGATLYARWMSDKSVKTEASANGELCVQPTPTPTPTPKGHPDTEISKSASVSEIMAGGSYDYTLTVVNDGSALATGVIVSDNLDNDLIVNSVTPSKGSCGPVSSGNQFSCDIGDLVVDEVATVVVNVTAPAAACPSVDNRASVTADNEFNDDQTLERSHSEIVVVEVICETETSTPTPTPSETPVVTPTPTPEGSQAGSTGTPKASATPDGSVAAATGTPKPLPNTATDPILTTPLVAFGFGILLLGSIGTLAYANVTASRRRR